MVAQKSKMGIRLGVSVLVLGLASGLAQGQEEASRPLAGWDRGFYLESPDGVNRLTIGGWLQPRYEYRSDAEDTSSFTLRRVRLDFRGTIFAPALTYRVLSEHARTSNLRDAWLNYAFDRSLQVQIGQFTVPFQLHRDVGPRRQHFAERGVPSETFGFATGRDVGLMVHGVLRESTLGYKVGVFDGAGRNVDRSNSDGNMASARLSWAALGVLPREESDYAYSESLQLAFGAGVQGAWRNELRAWALGRSAEEDASDRADWATGTLDTRMAWKGLSLAAEGYLRSVSPEDEAVDSYDGWAGMLSAGAFIIPKQLEVVGRWSRLRLDRDDADTELDEWGVGLNVYHRGHDWKTRVNYLNESPATGSDIDTFLVEWHLQF